MRKKPWGRFRFRFLGRGGSHFRYEDKPQAVARFECYDCKCVYRFVFITRFGTAYETCKGRSVKDWRKVFLITNFHDEQGLQNLDFTEPRFKTINGPPNRFRN